MNKTKNLWKIGAATAITAALAVGLPLSASAAVTDEAYVTNDTSTTPNTYSWDVDPVIGNLSGDTTVSVSGEGFTPVTSALGSNGIYIAFGGADFTSQSSSYYYSAVWAQPNGTTTTATRVPLIAGAFEEAQVVVAQAYDDITCLTSATDTTAGAEQCYIYTFSGWGAFEDPSDDPNFTQVPVYFE